MMGARESIEEMNDYYNLHAPEHDRCMGYTGSESMEQLLGALIRLFEQDIVGKNVLEIACGTGNWTQVLANRAQYVLATDANASVLEIAQGKEYQQADVEFLRTNAYRLDDIHDKFDAVFAADWWSHIPLAMIPIFLDGLHKKLHEGAIVIFIDMCKNEHLCASDSFFDDDGNYVHKRYLHDGGSFDVIMNFPNEKQLREYVSEYSSDIKYYENLYLQRWLLTYKL